MYPIRLSDCLSGYPCERPCEQALVSMYLIFIQVLLSCFLLSYVSECILASSTLTPQAQTRDT